MELKGSRTEKNLMDAFAGESMARNKYTYFASKARKEGYEQIAKLFEETADNERMHAKLWYKALQERVIAYKKFGKKTALAAASAMAVAFGIWEAYLSEVLAALEPIVGREIGGFPGTLMIICGWVPVVAVAWLLQKKNSAPSIKPAAVETASSPNPQ